MKIRRLILAATLLATAVCGGAVLGADAPDPRRKVFEARCSRCHPLDRPLRKSKTSAGWTKTVERMASHAAGAISGEEASLIISYLQQTRGPRP